MLDFLMSKDVQLEKLPINGSRSARTDIDPAATFTPEQVARLIPTDQFAKLRQGAPAVDPERPASSPTSPPTCCASNAPSGRGG